MTDIMSAGPSEPTVDPLLSTERLATWAQQRPLEDPEFAALVIEAVSTLLRHHGNSEWTMSTLPPRARDIGYIVAKDYYLNPRLLRQETTGPLQESIDAAALRGINLSEEQITELQSLAGNAPGQVDGLAILETTRGPVETYRNTRPRNVVLFDSRGAWPIEYLNEEDAVVFFPEGPVV